jgi:hypothetical protein
VGKNGCKHSTQLIKAASAVARKGVLAGQARVWGEAYACTP